MEKNLFGITMGDPCGIGPEITLKALFKNPDYKKQALLFGSYAAIKYYNDILGYDLQFKLIQSIDQWCENEINVFDPMPVDMSKIDIGNVSSLGGEIAFRSVEAAIKFALRKDLKSIVTAPLNKEALHLAGYQFAGHTEIFSALTKGKNYAMLLWGEDLKVIHVSTHVSLRKACDLCTQDRILDVIRLANMTLKKVGFDNPRIGVSGLNPHAGENGLFGLEEVEQIIPAIKNAQDESINVYGPIPPDTVFLKAMQGAWDIVVAMYHDQGHIPLKMISFDKGVNITVGLDVIRTSVDHGTAFDIAGKLIASERSLIEAIKIARIL